MSGTRLSPSRLQEDIRAWWAVHVKASEIPGFRAEPGGMRRNVFSMTAATLLHKNWCTGCSWRPMSSCYPQKGESILLACQVMARR